MVQFDTKPPISRCSHSGDGAKSSEQEKQRGVGLGLKAKECVLSLRRKGYGMGRKGKEATWVPGKSNTFPRNHRVPPCVLIGECSDTWLTVSVIGSLETWWALCKNIGSQSRRSNPFSLLSFSPSSPPPPSFFCACYSGYPFPSPFLPPHFFPAISHFAPRSTIWVICDVISGAWG